MALKAKNSKQNLADMMLENEKLKEKYEDLSESQVKKLDKLPEQELSKDAVDIKETMEEEEYRIPKRKVGRPYEGYSENITRKSIYINNELYDYVMRNYVGYGRKYQSFNKFINSAVKKYLSELDNKD